MTPQERIALENTARILTAGRKLSGKTQVEIAALLGISQGGLSKMESGQLMPSTAQWFAFCEMASIEPVDTFKTGFIDNCRSVALTPAYPGMRFKIPKEYKTDICHTVRGLLPLLRYFSLQLGEGELQRYFKSKEIDPDLFVVMDAQLNFQAVLDVASHLSQEGLLKPSAVQRIVAPVNEGAIHGKLHYDYDEVEGPIELLKKLIKNSKLYQADFKQEILNEERKEIVISVTPGLHLKRFRYKSTVLGDFLCRYRKSYLKRFASYGNLRSTLEIEEKECHFNRQDDRCVYQIKLSG